MKDLGTRLREARIEKGYTINVLQQITKIQKRYLQAIEEGDYDEIPGDFYIEAFIRSYAEAVDLDPDQLLEEYADELDLDLTEDNTQEVEELPSRLDREDEEESSLKKVVTDNLGMILLFAVIIAIMIMIIVAIQRSGKTETKEEPAPVENTVVSSVAPDSTSVKEESKEKEEPKEETRKLGPDDLKVGTEVIKKTSVEGEELNYHLYKNFSAYKITIKAKGYVWLGLYEDGGIVVDTTLDEGEEYEFKVNPGVTHARVRIGYPEGADIYVNNTLIPLDATYFEDTVVFSYEPEVLANSVETAIEGVVEDEEGETQYQGPAVLDPRFNQEETEDSEE